MGRAMTNKRPKTARAPVRVAGQIPLLCTTPSGSFSRSSEHRWSGSEGRTKLGGSQGQVRLQVEVQ